MSAIEQNNQGGYSDVEKNEEESNFDVRLLWGVFLRYKYWFIASVIVCVACAFCYLRYTVPVYNVSSKVLIKDREKRPYSASSISNTFSELGLMNSSDGFENEIEVLSTKTLNKKVVLDLKLYVKYFSDGRLKDREVYGKYSPYLVDLEGQLDSLLYPIEVKMAQEGEVLNVNIKCEDYELEKKLKNFPAKVATPFGDISIEKNPLPYMLIADQLGKYKYSEKKEETEVDLMKRNLTAYIYPIDAVATAYTGLVSVEATSKTTTVANISMNDNLPDRGCDYLNKLVEIYNEEANLDNNIEATRTEEFIKERIDKIRRELDETDTELETYKRNNKIGDYENDAKTTSGQVILYETQILEVKTQLELLNYLIEYVNDNRNRLTVIPTNVGLKDVALTQMISKYNETILERERLLRAATESSPSVVLVTTEAEGYINGIKTSMQSFKRQLSMQQNELIAQQSKYTGRVSSSPTYERVLGDIERSRKVRADLYLMLLQKREENAIQLASVAYKGKMIEEPVVAGPVSPKKKIILLLALVIGLALPFAYYYIRNFFSYRIENHDDLMKLTKIPLLGTVPLIKALAKDKKRTVVVMENRNSMMVEVYRTLRSNLPFVLPEDKNVILFTSSSAGEGKTSVASNLGTSIAFVGKKVLLMGLDIRKPRLAGLFNLPDTERGFSNYLTRSADEYGFLESLIQNSGVSPNLDIIPAGPIPPNPAELLERENLGAAIDYLKKKYDYILLDTAPIGLVADTLSIAKHADLTIYVVRANYTLKSDMALINELSAEHRLPNVNIVFNAVEMETTGNGSYKRYGGNKYGYGKGYSYGYGYGYGDEKDGNKKLEEI